MSLFFISDRESQQAREDALLQQPEAPGFWNQPFEGIRQAPAEGLARGGVGANQLAIQAGRWVGGGGLIGDPRANAALATPQDTDWERYFTQNRDDWTRLQRAYTVDPSTRSESANLISGLTSTLTTFTAGSLTGGPLVGAVSSGYGYGRESEERLLEQGADPATAAMGGTIEGGFMGAMGIAPVSVSGTLLQRMASGAGINLAFGVAQRGSMNAHLTNSGYGAGDENDLASQYQWMDGQAATIDAVLGAAFGGLFGGRGVPTRARTQVDGEAVQDGESVPAELVTAALVEADTMGRATAFGIPENQTSRRWQSDALSRMEEQAARDEPIDPGPVPDDVGFVDLHDLEMMAAEIEYHRRSLRDAPQGLANWVRRRGISDDRGDIAGMDDRGRGASAMLARDGRTIDELIEAAVADGFFPEYQDGNLPDANTFRDALERDIREPGSFTNDEGAAMDLRNARDVLRHYESRGIDTSLRGPALRDAVRRISAEGMFHDAIETHLQEQGLDAREVEARLQELRDSRPDMFDEDGSPRFSVNARRKDNIDRIFEEVESLVRAGKVVSFADAAVRIGLDRNAANAEVSQVRLGRRRRDLADRLAAIEELLVRRELEREAERRPIIDRIREAAEAGRSQADIAAELGIKKAQVTGIARTNDITFTGKPGRPEGSSLTIERDAQWLAENLAGDSFATIAARNDVTRPTVAGAIRRARIRQGQSLDVTPDYSAMAERLGIPEERVRAISASKAPRYSRGRPIFESAVLRAVEALGPDRLARDGTMTTDQWRAFLNGPGLKKAEREAIKSDLGVNLDDFIAAHGDERISRDDVLAFVRENGVKVEETVLGGESVDPEVQRQILPLIEERDRVQNAMMNGDDSAGIAAATQDARVQAAYQAYREAERAGVDALARELDGDTADYQSLHRMADQRRLELRAEARDLRSRLSEQISELQGEVRKTDTKWSQYTLPGGENYRELLLRLPEANGSAEARAAVEEKLDAAGYPVSNEDARLAHSNGIITRAELDAFTGAQNFRSSHFDQPNILAHVRFNERVDSEGRRTLFIEEVQSDWHQAGRERGYADGGAELEAAAAALREAEAEAARLQPKKGENGTPEFVAAYEALLAARKREQDARIAGNRAVPDAPFKNNAWASLSMKRMIRWAAENGFEQIAWTRGQQQLDRGFGVLARNVDQILYKEEGGLLTVMHKANGRPEQFRENGVSQERLRDLIGKDAADLLLARDVDDGGYRSLVPSEISSSDITVGAGQRAFYDKILPNIANDLGKKFGARVGETAIDITPQAGRLEFTVVDPQGQPYDAFDTLEAARQAARDAGPGHRVLEGSEPVHSLPITPEMREQALEGQALFARGDGNAGSTVAELEASAAAELGADWTALSRAGKVEIVQSSADVPAGMYGLPRGVAAVHMRDTRTTYFVANNIRPGDMRGLVLHEIGVHHGFEAMLGKSGYKEVLRQIERMVESDHPAITEARAIAERYSAREEHIPEETLAYLVEMNADLPLVQRVLSRIRQWLIKTFGSTFGMRLTVDDLRALAITSLRRVAEQARRDGAPDGMVEVNIDPRYSSSDGPDAGGFSVRNATYEEVSDARSNRADLPRLFQLSDGENGHIRFERTPQGYRIFGVRVPEGSRGQGRGQALYEELIRRAEAEGLPVLSDHIVTRGRHGARRVYDALEARGYQVERDAGGKPVSVRGPSRTAPDGGPVQAGRSPTPFYDAFNNRTNMTIGVPLGGGRDGISARQQRIKSSIGDAPLVQWADRGDGQRVNLYTVIDGEQNSLGAVAVDELPLLVGEERAALVTQSIAEGRLNGDIRMRGGAVASGATPVRTEAVDQGLIARAVEHFGLTNDPREAGYVLPDGKMLDLSGRHEMLGGDYVRQGQRNVATGMDYQRGQRQTDHRDIPSEWLTQRGNWGNASDASAEMLDFQTQASAVRLMPNSGISVTVRPTPRQIERIARMWNKEFRGEPLLVDIDTPTGTISESIERPNVENITRFFDEHFEVTGAGNGSRSTAPNAGDFPQFSVRRDGQNGDNLLGAKRDPIESPDFQRELDRIRSGGKEGGTGEASGRPGEVGGVRGDAATGGRRAGDAPRSEQEQARSLIRETLAVSGIRIVQSPVRKSGLGMGAYRAEIDTPVASDADAFLQAAKGADGGRTGIDFDLIDGSNPKETRLPGVYLRLTRINDGAKNTGAGVWLYRQLVDWADRQGLPVYSDFSISPDAQRVYPSLERRGYRVEQINAAARDPDDGSLVNVNFQPIFRISRTGIEEAYAAAPPPREDYQIDGPTLRERQEAVDAKRKAQEEYDKLSGAEQVVRDDPDTPMFSYNPKKRPYTAREMLEQAEAERQAAAEMRKGFEAAARCAARHGASQGVRYGVLIPTSGVEQAFLGQALGLAMAIPFGITAAPILAQQGDARGYARRRMQAQNPGLLAAMDAGLDAPAVIDEPARGERVTDLAFQAGEDRDWAYDREEPAPSVTLPEVSEGFVKPGQAVPESAPTPEAGDDASGADLARLFDPIINRARDEQ